jgi:hypothetical protein
MEELMSSSNRQEYALESCHNRPVHHDLGIFVIGHTEVMISAMFSAKGYIRTTPLALIKNY